VNDSDSKGESTLANKYFFIIRIPQNIPIAFFARL
jgi:hypothetical protein